MGRFSSGHQLQSGAKSRELAKQSETLANKRELFKAVKARKDAKDMEREVRGRISVLAPATASFTPHNDRRMMYTGIVLVVFLILVGGMMLALRDGLGMDLQKLVHEDMSVALSEYPTIWGLKKPDRNIDHRRVPNLMRYFERKGYSLSVSRSKKDYLAGDIVTCTVDGRPHIMVVSDRKTGGGVPLVIHNIGRGRHRNKAIGDDL